MKSALTLSIVIPVYNEEGYIKECLTAISKQNTKPLEVLLIDNNSTDRTVEIAEKFNFVTILREKRQHQTFAQATGFKAAKGDILGRIDADTVLPANWVDTVTAAFEEQADLAALVGGADPLDVSNKLVAVGIFYFYHHYMARLFWGQRLLWGTNCAIRAKNWRGIQSKMKLQADLWEDYEMSYWLAKTGRIKFLRHLKAGCSFRAGHKGFVEQIKYQFRNIKTYRLHHNILLTGVYFVLWYSMILLFPVAMIDNYVAKKRSS